MKQPNESIDEIFLFVIDQSYTEDHEDVEAVSDQYRRELEAEYGVTAIEADIGPSASIPAFLVAIATATVPLWALAPAIFFAGKPIRENFEAWAEIARTIRGYFKRPVILARNGAAALAFESVMGELARTPTTLKLVSYRTLHQSNVEDFKSLERSDQIEDGADTLFLGFASHVFEIEADGRLFRTLVDGREVTTLEIAD